MRYEYLKIYINLKFKIGITQTLLKLLGVPGFVPQTKHYLTDARDPLFCRARLSKTHRGTGREDAGFLRSPETEEVCRRPSPAGEVVGGRGDVVEKLQGGEARP
jgi:hypothetical protein